mmetsp:Transcript_30258/g.52008  ORF Transcript_30258/g.52008 Transcript_30258/m.52008 type:complete len:291 (+) Transcript_30258:130-1002(+)
MVVVTAAATAAVAVCGWCGTLAVVLSDEMYSQRAAQCSACLTGPLVPCQSVACLSSASGAPCSPPRRGRRSASLYSPGRAPCSATYATPPRAGTVSPWLTGPSHGPVRVVPVERTEPVLVSIAVRAVVVVRGGAVRVGAVRVGAIRAVDLVVSARSASHAIVVRVVVYVGAVCVVSSPHAPPHGGVVVVAVVRIRDHHVGDAVVVRAVPVVTVGIRPVVVVPVVAVGVWAVLVAYHGCTSTALHTVVPRGVIIAVRTVEFVIPAHPAPRTVVSWFVRGHGVVVRPAWPAP